MHEFRYLRNNLFCERVKVEDLAKRWGTPLYVYSYKTLLDHYWKLKNAFREINPLICYSVKANSNLSILKILVEQGAGLDIVSGGELFRAIKVKCPPKRIVYASVGKTEREIETAIRQGILFFNVESVSELENINRIAERLGKKTNVSLRINPDVEPQTHRFITTGKLTNKFGLDFQTAEEILKKREKYLWLKIKGLHIHIGSQIIESSPFVSAIRKLVSFHRQMKEEGIDLEYLNIGGGLGIIYYKEKPQTAKEFALCVIPILKETQAKVILEPGRFIAGPSGILVVKVLYIKSTPSKNFIIVDGAMNDLIRPALYGAYHEILPVTKFQNQKSKIKNQKYDIVGPICESGDFFAKDREISPLREGDYLAIMGAGAYGFSMSSNYNSRCRVAEVLVKDDKAYLIRRRETYRDLVRNEVVIDKF
ncbi:MAG: diaminopimelate decarboxylase [Candidatus Omnitrophica bacterium]|nr:diaminopimelate decarboxylase [Candidatus Omnitrophota bacterium]MCM8793811.1 diaminopimelate decarboxylase [Candidatus Omnitrophota bacterium]